MQGPLVNDIAVVGIAHKLPEDCQEDSQFWEILENAKNLSGKWPEERMNADAHPHPRSGKIHQPGGHFIQDHPAGFDAPFFGLTAKEAAAMDPVQRWTLEVAYRAFENAGIPFENLKGSGTAVLSATFTEDYMRMAAMDPDNVERTAATGCLASVIPNRVSYFFGMHGPSMHVDTACSSGLSAFDMACKLLYSGDAEAALVTAANLILEPGMYQMFRNLQMLSPDNTCKTFDHRANGYGRGEGVLAYVLKPVTKALRDGDIIRAVVRGVASNQDGRTPALSQPSAAAHEQLIRHVYGQAGLGMAKTRYVEAHGTGTQVGDPIEIKAIGSAFRQTRSTKDPLFVGSVKSNIGHLEGASGLAGILKAILILEKGIIPPNALFEKLNPAIDAEDLRVAVPSKCMPWPSTGLRRVSINGFGFGGSNTHVIIDDALHYLEERGLVGQHCTVAAPPVCGDQIINTPEENGNHAEASHGVNGALNGSVNGAGNGAANGDANATVNGDGGSHSVERHDNDKRLLVYSGFDDNAARRAAERFSNWYQANKKPFTHDKLDALAYTLAARRSHLRWRGFAVATPEHIESPLSARKPLALATTDPVRVESEPGLAWVFTGQGAQYVDMGWQLIGLYPVFEQTLRRADQAYRSLGCPWSIFDELRSPENINKPNYSQPLSTAIQLGVVELLKSFGLVPRAVVGHSSGEIVAAYAVGALSLEAACKVAYYRGYVASKLQGGSMISINLASDQISDFLAKIRSQVEGPNGELNAACYNSPSNVTLSGPEEAIDAAKAQADQDGIFSAKLKTGVAYHSKAMQVVGDEYLSLMGNTLAQDEVKWPDVPVLSTVSGKKIDPSELAKGQHWVDNMVSPVQFASAVRAMEDLDITDFVEVGSHPALKRFVQDTYKSNAPTKYLTALQRNHEALDKTLEMAGTLFSRGHPISIPAVNRQKLEVEKPQLLVDLPPYPFDHSIKFWAESRISKDYRLRTATAGEFLGERVTDWNPLQPRWRNFLSVETAPWIGHHVVGDAALFPAAGMLIMAMEAAREMVPADRTVSGYFVQEARFKSPIVVLDQFDDKIETMLSLNPDKRRPEWSEITLFTYASESHKWTEVFTANIQVRYGSDTEADDVDEDIQVQHREAKEACGMQVDSQVLYSSAAEQGLKYGDWFSLCEDVRWDKERAQALASVRSNAARFETASLVHPAVLDTVFHVLRVSSGQQRAANVPVKLENAWIASSGWQASATSSIHWLATSHKKAGQSTKPGERGSVSALADDGTILANFKELTTAAVLREADTQDGTKKMLYGIERKPQLSLLSPQQLSNVCKADVFPLDGDTMLKEHRERTAVLNMVAVRYLRDMPEERRTGLNSTLRHQVDWIEQHVKTLPQEERDAAANLTDAEYEGHLDNFANKFPAWTLYPHVARNLLGIVKGEEDPLQVIFESDHAKTFYSSLFHTVCGDGRLDRFMELAAHETPALRILEVGAGTGGMTVHVLNALKEREKRTGAMAFSEYMYTDISPVFFESAKARWAEEGLGSRMAYKTFDMEKTVAEQGFTENSYDLVVAGSCVHATGLVGKAVRGLHRALKPGGKLVLLEVTDPTDIATCFFATLASGWWLSQEEWRVKAKSPLASEDTWNQLLKENGFSGNDLVIRDTSEEEAHIVSVIVSTAVEMEQQDDQETKQNGVNAASKRVYVIDSQQSGQKELATTLAAEQDTILAFEDLNASSIGQDDIVVSLAEVDQPFLANLSETQFSHLQALFRETYNLLWVNATKDGPKDVNIPYYALADGFLRTLRAETSQAKIASLSIEDATDLKERASRVSSVIEKVFGESPAEEREYVVRDGMMHTSRVVQEVAGNEKLNSLLSPSIQELAWKDSPAVKLAAETPGNLESLRFVQEVAYHSKELGHHDIEIEATAWGLSPRDMRTATGHGEQDNEDNALGGDCAGVVTRVGSQCDPQGPKPGDNVLMLARGCMSKFPRAHQDLVYRTHEMAPESAVAALDPILTAYHAVVDVARVMEGDTVLVHEAGSAIGQMVVQIAKMNGAEVFATLRVSTSKSSEDEETEKQLLTETLGIAADHVFPLKSFAAGVKSATQDRLGVDAVIGALAGDERLASLHLLAPGGRFVDLGTSEKSSSASLFADLALAGSLASNTTLATVDTLSLRPKLISRLLKNTMPLLESGKLTSPSPVRVFPVSQVQNAFKKLQDGEVLGRVIITPRPDDEVPQLVLADGNRQPWRFDENASYLIPGGLGGVGRSIMTWMVSRGAKHLIVPSRSGASSKAAQRVVAVLESRGVKVSTPKCNVGIESDLVAMLDEAEKTMPPIRGVINCAMALINSVFSNMTYEVWSSAMESKVSASFNLHRHLPRNGHKELDFVVHLASLAGVTGQISSANYAAGCTFQDALARSYSNATILDVGWMSDVGLVAETAIYQRKLRDWGSMALVEERELLEVLAMVCDRGQKETETDVKRSTGQQLLVGLLTPADYIAKGKPVPPALPGRPLLSTFAQPIDQYNTERSGQKTSSSSDEGAQAQAVDHPALFLAAEDDKARARVVSAALAEKLARAMMMSADNVDSDATLSAYGVDSLMAVELRNWIMREFGAVLGMWEMMSGDKIIKTIAETVVQKSNLLKK